jgi:FKBP-type peptidyl-prolyl cis-trans isomerase (trigger factor)
MMPKVKQFVILDCLEKTLAEAVKDEGLELVSDEVKPTLDDEQTKALTKEFKEKEGFKYTIDCELKPGDSEMGNIGLTEEQQKV